MVYNICKLIYFLYWRNAVKNIELLFEYNKNKSIKSSKRNIKLITKGNFKFWRLKNNDCNFSGDNIYSLLCDLNHIITADKYKLPIQIQLNTITFNDKLVFVILECICYYLINIARRMIIVSFNSKKTIWTDGIFYSPLKFLNNNYNEFNNKFWNDLQLKHFRQIIDYNNIKTDYLNHISTKILFFFKRLGLEDSTTEILCEAIVEIVGNAIEHGHSDCLIDIDVTNDEYQKKHDSNDSLYYGINVIVLNFSENSFYGKLMQKLLNADNLNERYLKVNEAKKFHSQYFDKNYTEKDFYTIAAFQHKISGSIGKGPTGGVGLTHLIKSLEEKSSGHICYVLCQKRVLYFSKELLQYDEDNYIGFNNENDFFKHIPESSIFDLSDTYFPGTAYNLNFAIKKGEIENGQQNHIEL